MSHPFLLDIASYSPLIYDELFSSENQLVECILSKRCTDFSLINGDCQRLSKYEHVLFPIWLAKQYSKKSELSISCPYYLQEEFLRKRIEEEKLNSNLTEVPEFLEFHAISLQDVLTQVASLLVLDLMAIRKSKIFMAIDALDLNLISGDMSCFTAMERALHRHGLGILDRISNLVQPLSARKQTGIQSNQSSSR
jgi:hypothetical protein